jgi:predicted nucleotidyltransferase
MTQPNHNRLLAAARDVVAALADIEITPTFVGGLAVSLVGKARYTNDVDALIVFDTANTQSLLDALTRHGFRLRIAKMAELARTARMVTVLHEATNTVVDIALGCMPFETELQERSSSHEMDGFVIRLPTPEDLVIMKAIAGRPKDLEDIRNIGRSYPHLDRRRIRNWVEQYGEVLENPDLWSEIEPLLGGE